MTVKLHQAPMRKELVLREFAFDHAQDAPLILEQLGLFPGVILEVLHTAPLGDPLTIKIAKKQSFALERSLCQNIIVETL